MDAIDAQLTLGRAAGTTAQQLRTALQALRTDEAALCTASLSALIGQSASRLEQLGLPRAASAWLSVPDLACIERDRAWAEREQVHLIDALSPGYPPLLAQAPAAPALLYVRGESAALCCPQLSIVGSRNPTEGGRRTAREFAAHLSLTGLTITSGLALGIDAASHEGALGARGRTIAVLGSGLDQLYPREHRALASRIAAHGALVSEFPPGTPPLKLNFPRRNRIISALALGTLVIEATRYSGSLVTARLAAEQGREVFAIPGSIHNPLARGCHALIRSGAKLVECAADVLCELRFFVPQQTVMPLEGDPDASVAKGDALDKDYKILLDALGFELAGIDALVQRTGFPSQSVASMLLILELEGVVQMQAGGRYMRIQSR